jgi:hypothetical protein
VIWLDTQRSSALDSDAQVGNLKSGGTQMAKKAVRKGKKLTSKAQEHQGELTEKQLEKVAGTLAGNASPVARMSETQSQINAANDKVGGL